MDALESYLLMVSFSYIFIRFNIFSVYFLFYFLIIIYRLALLLRPLQDGRRVASCTRFTTCQKYAQKFVVKQQLFFYVGLPLFNIYFIYIKSKKRINYILYN